VSRTYIEKDKEDLFKQNLERILEYVKDRLYQFQVPVVNEANIIERDDAKLVFVVDGKDRGKDVKLKVTLNRSSPELLDVIRI
jgi:hypothetical protein